MEQPIREPKHLKLSVVIVAHEMERELPRTLTSLSPGYQQQIGPDDYEVIVVDNGSSTPIRLEQVAPDATNVRLVRLDPAPASPARAINVGLGLCRGDVVGVMIDGAHLLTPGVLHYAIAGTALADRAVVATLPWNLGWDGSMTLALGSGFDQVQEDALLERIGWPDAGYRLFELGAAIRSDGWLAPLYETNALFMRRELWHELGGADERFDQPGGGFLNLDLLRRAVELPRTRYVLLLGEGTFHQVHGDLAQRGSPDRTRERTTAGASQYERIRGHPYAVARPVDGISYVGPLRGVAVSQFAWPLIEADIDRSGPFGGRFDPALWMAEQPTAETDPQIRELVALAQQEFRARRLAAAAAVCRLARSRLGQVPEIMRILSLASPWLELGSVDDAINTEVHIALGNAHELFDERDESRAAYLEALRLDPNAPRAHLGLARLRMPGPDYQATLNRLQEWRRPEIYFEIGVAKGHTLALARSPTVAIGVDPMIDAKTAFTTETHLFAMPSDELFDSNRLVPLLAGRTISMAFIDGLHTFEQALRDFANVEALSDADTVVLLHDTVPLDEPTQRRERVSTFWTGDVWRLIVCLRECRPDLEIFTIRAAPTGLAVIRNLDPGSRVIKDRFEDLAARYLQVEYTSLGDDPYGGVETVSSDWEELLARLSRSSRDDGRTLGQSREAISGLREEVGCLQLDFLVRAGLQPEHRVLDVGCESLRTGVHLVRYLAPGNYYGVDLQASLLEAGYEHEIIPAGLASRLPRDHLRSAKDFEAAFAGPIDVALAQSVFTHHPPADLRTCLEALEDIVRPGGRFFVTFYEAAAEEFNAPKRHEPGGILTYSTHDPYHYRPEDLIRAAAGTAWTCRILGRWGHPSDQRIAEFKRCALPQVEPAVGTAGSRPKGRHGSPDVSIVVVAYNMERELPRTLRSLSRSMQRGIADLEYEVIIVDNGSEHAVERPAGPEYRVIRVRDALPSPARAVNVGLAAARGNLIGVLIDGARIVSPGLIRHAVLADGLDNRAVISTLGFHIGPDIQQRSVRRGYDQMAEDLLLDGSGWENDPYRLFSISVFAMSAAGGWFLPMDESNALFMRRALWNEIRGYDERFVSPGGGMVNLDTFARASSLRATQSIVLLGEGTFHQVHGGAATNAVDPPVEAFAAEYVAIRGEPFTAPALNPLLLGTIHPDALPSVYASALNAHQKLGL